MAKRILRQIAKYLMVSTIIVVAVTAAAVIFAHVARDYAALNYVFTANFYAGGIIIVIGLFPILSSAGMAWQRARYSAWMGDYEERKELKQANRRDMQEKILGSLKLVYVGIGVLLITMLAQFLLGR